MHACPAAGVATLLLPRYASPVAIMAHAMRAILLARATAATLRGLRSSKASSQAEALCIHPARAAAVMGQAAWAVSWLGLRQFQGSSSWRRDAGGR